MPVGSRGPDVPVVQAKERGVREAPERDGGVRDPPEAGDGGLWDRHVLWKQAEPSVTCPVVSGDYRSIATRMALNTSVRDGHETGWARGSIPASLWSDSGRCRRPETGTPGLLLRSTHQPVDGLSVGRVMGGPACARNWEDPDRSRASRGDVRRRWRRGRPDSCRVQNSTSARRGREGCSRSRRPYVVDDQQAALLSQVTP